MLRCGMSELDITPVLGSTMPGYFNDRKSDGILDPLYAKALAIESDSGEPVAFVVLDAILIPDEIVGPIRERVARMSDIPPERVMISATHTHTGPPVAKTTFLESDPDYLLFLTNKAADAAVLAWQNRKEARLGYGTGIEADIAFNRRFYMADGTVRTNPGIGNPQVARAAGPIDPEVAVVRIDHADGSPMGVIANYALHTDTVGGTKYCADFPGELSSVLKRAYGDSFVSMFMMGTSGNINHHDVFRTGKVVRDPQLPYYKQLGRILAGEVLRVREKIVTTDEATLRMERAHVGLQYRQPAEQEVMEAKRILAEMPAGGTEWNFARELLQAYEYGEGAVDAEIQVIRIGDLAVAGFPGEIFVEYGLALKAASPFECLLINELCNGIPGTYICTLEAYDQGGYEPRITSNNRLQIETGNLFLETAKQLLTTCHSS